MVPTMLYVVYLDIAEELAKLDHGILIRNIQQQTK